MPDPLGPGFQSLPWLHARGASVFFYLVVGFPLGSSMPLYSLRTWKGELDLPDSVCVLHNALVIMPGCFQPVPIDSGIGSRPL